MLAWKDVPEGDMREDPTNKGLAERVAALRRSITSIARDAAWEAKDMAGKVRGAVATVTDAGWRVTKGYDTRDLWELGTSICDRMHELLGRLAETGDAATSKRMRAARETIWAWGHYDDDMFLADAGDENAERVRRILQARFEEEWRWVGSTVMGAGASCIGHASCDYAGDTRMSVPTGFRVAADRLCRRIPDDGTPAELLPARELRRIAAMLDDFARIEIGHPIEYASSEHVLVDRPEGWEERPLPIGVAISGNARVREATRESARRAAEASGHVTEVVVRCSDIGIDYAAYLDDVTTAARSLDDWANWLDGISGVPSGDDGRVLSLPTAARIVSDVEGGTAAAREMEQSMADRFTRAWEWLGHNFRGLWM